MSAAKYDAVIIGGGHNGLTCGAYLARAGKKVLVLERRHVIGGGNSRAQRGAGDPEGLETAAEALTAMIVNRALQSGKLELLVLALSTCILFEIAASLLDIKRD